MSSRLALHHARDAQSQLLPIHAETCPHYLYLLSSKLAETAPDDEYHGHWEGAKHVCAPPLRHSEEDLQCVWDAVNDGTVNVISSDHAASKYAHADGKQKPLRLATESSSSGSGASTTTPTFNQIPNGLPGLETRLPLLFHSATAADMDPQRTLSLPRFVALTSTNPAKLYGLDGVKGSVAPGYDADLCIWYPPGDPRGVTTTRNQDLHHDIDYTPFEGVRVENWPRWVLLRGQVKWDRDGGGVVGKPGDGVFLKRRKGKLLVGRTSGEVVGMMEGERALWMD